MDTETLTNYSSLIVNGECDLAKVSWPRHADGSCDYDEKILIPEPFLIDDVIPTQNKIEKSILQQKNDNKIETVIIDVKNIQQGIINQKFVILYATKRTADFWNKSSSQSKNYRNWTRRYNWKYKKQLDKDKNNK